MLKSRKIPITKPSFNEKEELAVVEVLRSGWSTQGPKVAEFEKRFAEKVGSKYACAVSSCTTAMHLGLLAVGVKPGNLVLTVSHSFIATANSIRHTGAEPIFVDINPNSYNLCSEKLERILNTDTFEKNNALYYKHTERLSVGESPLIYMNKDHNEYGKIAAIMPVHQAGMPADMESINTIAKKYNLPVIEDAACAAGSDITSEKSLTMKKIGAPHSELACFSLHPRKVINTGDGGMITTNNEEADKLFRLYRQHGMGISDLLRHGSNKVICEDYLLTGYNYRMTDIQASIGIEQLAKLDKIVESRRSVAKQYKDAFENIEWCKTPYENPYYRSCYQSYILKLSDDRISQLEFMQYLVDHGIASKRGVMNAHQENPYLDQKWNLPNSEEARDRAVLLPLYPSMDQEDIEYVIDTVKRFKS